jgi:hypothetical protein
MSTRTATPYRPAFTYTPTALVTELPATTTPSPTSTGTPNPPTVTPQLADTETTMPATVQPSATTSLAPPSATPSQTTTITPNPPINTSTPTGISTQPRPPDTTGPKVSNVTVDPNPIFTNGQTIISAHVYDTSGVANVTLYYKNLGSKDKYISAGKMTLSRDIYSITLGPIAAAGGYDLRVHAIDTLNNESCSTTNLENCSGGTLTVNIP